VTYLAFFVKIFKSLPSLRHKIMKSIKFEYFLFIISKKGFNIPILNHMYAMICIFQVIRTQSDSFTSFITLSPIPAHYFLSMETNRKKSQTHLSPLYFNTFPS